jgi:uncharacterized protein YuzE
MKIKYDPAADALYIRLAGPGGVPGHTDVTEHGVIVDVAPNGDVRGFEFLSVRSHGLPTQDLPSDVARAVQAFVESGALETRKPIERDYS